MCKQPELSSFCNECCANLFCHIDACLEIKNPMSFIKRRYLPTINGQTIDSYTDKNGNTIKITPTKSKKAAKITAHIIAMNCAHHR